jgi:CHASE2 domain-containing sensor protein
LPEFFPAWLACLILAMLLAGVRFAGFARRPFGRLAPVAALILLIVAASYIAGCAGHVAAVPAGTPAGTYTISVTAASGTDVHTTSATLIVQ